MAATNAQVQQYVNERVRPWAERARALYLEAKDHKAAIDDVYANLTDNPTWQDQRADAPAHLLTPSDVLAWNTFITGLVALVEGGAGAAEACAAAPAQWPVVLDACVRPVNG